MGQSSVCLFIVWKYCEEVSSVSALRLICQIGAKNLEGSRTQKVGEEFWVLELKIPKSYFQRNGAVMLLTRHVFCFASHLQNWAPLVVPSEVQNPKNLGGIFAARIINFEIVFLSSTMYFAFYFIFFAKLGNIPSRIQYEPTCTKNPFVFEKFNQKPTRTR